MSKYKQWLKDSPANVLNFLIGNIITAIRIGLCFSRLRSFENVHLFKPVAGKISQAVAIDGEISVEKL